MTLIKPTDKPEITLIYTTNGCAKFNIQDGPNEVEYIEMLKNGQDGRMAMPFVFPAAETGLAGWNDFQPAKIKELIAKLGA